MTYILGQITRCNKKMSSSVGCTVAAFNGAKYAAPYVKNNLSQSAQEAVGVFFGGNSPTVQFQPQAFGQETGPTTAFSTTTEARRWDHVINSFLIMEKMHDHQQFPTLLAPLELAKGMTFTTRVFTSNLEAPEEAPEHVPAPFSTTQWSETKTALTMVHRSVKFSLHELKTEKGQQDYKVHLSNLALMFLRDTHAVILRKFAKQTTLMQALMSFYPNNKRVHKELMHNTIRSFGMLNVNPTGLDAMVSNVKQIGTTQNVNFDTCVVPYGSLSNLALSRQNFVLTETAITLARDLAKMADINHPTKIPTHVFNNEFNVFQYQKNADQIQNPMNDPLANTAAVATYHPFGSDPNYMPGSRDIQVISPDMNGWATLKFKDAIQQIQFPDVTGSYYVKDGANGVYDDSDHKSKRSSLFIQSHHVKAHLYGQLLILWNDVSSVTAITENLKHHTFERILAVLMNSLNSAGLDYPKTADSKELKTINKKTAFPFAKEFCPDFAACVLGSSQLFGLSPEDIEKLSLFALFPLHKDSICMHLEGGINFPFEVSAVRPFIELETANAVFCKRGRETAVTYVLPPWTFIGRDNRIEMVDMKFGFWRECHVERPANILVAEHAFVTRVKSGMGTNWMKESAYVENPYEQHQADHDVFPMITGPINPRREHPSIAVISANFAAHELKTQYEELESELKEFKHDMIDMNSFFKHSDTSISPTLWNKEVLNDGAIPRVCALGTTRQMKVELNGDRPVRCTPTEVIKNKGHMKELDSEEWIGSLCGFAQSQVATSDKYF